MNHSRKVDQDDIVRARNVLLASGRRTPGEEVDAYRVLAQVSPASYLPLLAGALQRLCYDTGSGTRHASAPELCAEAVAVARRIDPAEPARADVLYQALDSHRRELYRLGRRTEGLALCGEMLDISRAQAAAAGAPVVKGLDEWAAGLAEEGRYAEAADAMDELVAALLPQGPRSGALAWTLLDRIAALLDAGRVDDGLAAFEAAVTMEAADAAADRGPMVCHLYALVGYARLLDTHGRDERAALARQEALAVLTELADTGERKTWSGYQRSFWAALVTLSGAYGDRSPVPDEPRPPSDTAPMRGSPRAQWHDADSRRALRAQVDALVPRAAEDPDRHLADLVRLHRGLTLRTAVFQETRTRLIADDVRSLYDEGVDLARRLARHDPAKGPRALAGRLIDRSALHAVTHAFGPALDDFRQALTCLGEPA